MVRYIERDGYVAFDWPEDSSKSILNLLAEYPEIYRGRFFVCTSLDSGQLRVSDEERTLGWQYVGNLTHSPRIQSLEEIPYDHYTEYLILEHPDPIGTFDTLVNYGGFSPIDFSREEKLSNFWKQVGELQPLHVVGENDGLYLVTRDKDLAVRIQIRERTLFRKLDSR